MKKVLSLILTLIMFLSFPVTSFAAEAEATENSEIKTVEVALADVIQPFANATAKKVLGKDFANSSGTGKIISPGQIVDFTNAVPAGSTIVSVKIYCPTAARRSQSPYTTIDNYVLTHLDSGIQSTVKFQVTDNPSTISTTTFFANQAASSRWIVQLEGTILMQYTGMDGFTVYGSTMIIEYK